MFCWDVSFGWVHRHETRHIASKGRQEIEDARAAREEEAKRAALEQGAPIDISTSDPDLTQTQSAEAQLPGQGSVDGSNCDKKADYESTLVAYSAGTGITPSHPGGLSSPTLLVSGNSNGQSVLLNSDRRDAQVENGRPLTSGRRELDKTQESADTNSCLQSQGLLVTVSREEGEQKSTFAEGVPGEVCFRRGRERQTLVSLVTDTYSWLQETFPTVTAVVSHLPFALVPFALSMFVLVQALVTKGWVSVFAYGWDHWVDKTGTVGSIGGMGFLSAVLCNVRFLRSIERHEALLTHDRLTNSTSSPAPTSVPRSSSPASSKHGSRSTSTTTFPSPIGPSGEPCMAWL